MSQELPFEPFSFIHDPHYQTIISSFFNLLFDPVSDSRIIPLSDGDKLCVEVTTPLGWKPTDLTVVMVHGACGSHQSPYLVRMVKRLEPKNIRSVRVNLRGCGSGKGLAKHSYHGGRSEDVFEVLKTLKRGTPDSPMLLIGFSLGGNIALKLAGELHSLGQEYLKAVIAVSPPVDLYSSVQMISDPANVMYERYFYKLLREDVLYRQKVFKDLPRVQLPKELKLYEFDQLYLAPYCGFKSAMDYYEKCSSIYVIENIAVPCKILLAEDDPIISSKSLDQFHLPSHIEVYKTKKGGHMGYLSNPRSETGFYWLDSLLVRWIDSF
ncbi:MAG: alpha/beta fold hydrolase [Verrucomicrobiota bacterium]|nr:alpha/beta fold hydrolase [Verrucomicrobiota bacterium]